MKLMNFLAFIIAACLVCTTFTSCFSESNREYGGSTSIPAETLYDDIEELEFTSNGDGTCYVSGIGTCTVTDIIIPTYSPDGDKVTKVGNSAFLGCTNLTNITVPDSVTSIGYHAFHDCSNLTSVVFGEDSQCTSIGDGAFEYCSSLTNITIPNGVESVGEGAFDCCVSLTSLTIPDSVTSIGYGAFADCESLESIAVGDKNTVYHSEENCLIETSSKRLILGCQNSVIPDDGSVTRILDSAFLGCTNLTSIIIPDCIVSIGDWAFFKCTNLKDITVGANNKQYTSIDGNLYSKHGYNLIQYAIGKSDERFIIPEGVINIGEYAFFGCSGLTSITIPDSITTIEQNAFSDCSGLTSITIPDSITTIEQNAFSGCSSLTSITIPDSITTIEQSAFSDCTSLTTVNYTGTEEQWNAISIYAFGNDPLREVTVNYNYTAE